MDPSNAPKILSWTGRCLNPDCPDPQRFEVKVSSAAVCFMLCKSCQTRHSLTINNTVSEFKIRKTEMEMF